MVNIMTDTINMLRDFEHLVRQLRFGNRHFVQGEIGAKLLELVLDNEQYSIIARENRLFRARICSADDCDNVLNLHHRRVAFGTFDLNSKLCYTEPDSEANALAGYNENDSGAPPASLCGENRANGKGVKRLYVAESARTAIMETKPNLGNLVSIAELQATMPPFLVFSIKMLIIPCSP